MKGKSIITVISSIFMIIVGVVLNFTEFLMGSPATIKNLIVTLVYLATWAYLMTISAKHKNHMLMKYFSAIWIITLVTAIITVYVNITDILASWLIPFVLLFLGPFYGIRFFVDSSIIVLIIIAIVSLIMISIIIVSFRKSK